MLRMFPLWLLLAGLGFASYDAFFTRWYSPAAQQKAAVTGVFHSMEDGTPIPPPN